MAAKPSTIASAVNQFRKNLGELRANVARLHRERDHLLSAALTAPEREQQVKAAVAYGASIQRRRLRAVASDFLSPVAPEKMRQLPDHSGPNTAWELACYFGGDRLVADLVALAGEMASDGDTLTRAERERRVGEINAELLTLEHEEEAAVSELETAGLTVDRRADADPRAVLAVQ